MTRLRLILVGWPARAWQAIRSQARRTWRIVTNRCVLCGKPIEDPPVQWDVHYRHPEPHACRTCNKTLNFARAYGAGPRTVTTIGPGPTR